MSARHKLYLNFFLLFFSQFFLNTKDALGSSEKNTFVIDDQTKISFSIPSEIFRYSEEISNSIEVVDFKNVNFNSLLDFSGFESFKYYLTKIQLQNSTNTIKKISLLPGLNLLKSEFFLLSDDEFRSFKNSPGTNSNRLSSVDAVTANVQPATFRNFTFEIAPGKTVDLYHKFQMPNKAHAINVEVLYYQTESYQEVRRFGLWLEGIILGSILGLLVFTFYSYYQIRDKTTLYFGLWLITAVFAIIGQSHHDGARLLEFIIRPMDDNPFLVLSLSLQLL